MEKLLEHIVESGMDPNYEITMNGKLTEANSSGGIGCYKLRSYISRNKKIKVMKVNDLKVAVIREMKDVFSDWNELMYEGDPLCV